MADEFEKRRPRLDRSRFSGTRREHLAKRPVPVCSHSVHRWNQPMLKLRPEPRPLNYHIGDGVREADLVDAGRRRGRGAVSNKSGRFEPIARVVEDDGWGSTEDLPAFVTQVIAEKAKTVITRNDSPDI